MHIQLSPQMHQALENTDAGFIMKERGTVEVPVSDAAVQINLFSFNIQHLTI